MADQLTITSPDDWHVHLRDEQLLERVVADTARTFRRAIVMPNLRPPVTTVAAARAYRERIQAACPEALDFTPLMTLYLTETTDSADLIAAAQSGLVTAVKLYPAGATTNSASGVRDIDKVIPVLEAMAEAGVPHWPAGAARDKTPATAQPASYPVSYPSSYPASYTSSGAPVSPSHATGAGDTGAGDTGALGKATVRAL